LYFQKSAKVPETAAKAGGAVAKRVLHESGQIVEGVGSWVGKLVGARVGVVGAWVGDLVGAIVGCSVGELVG
jgi:hypothetical protein